VNGNERADGVEEAVAAAFREEWGQVVATLIRVTGDWDLAEECAQDAFAQALDRWRRDGVPRRPGAWLTTTARNRAMDVLRRGAVGAAKLREVAVLARDGGPFDPHDPDFDNDSGVTDDRLRLLSPAAIPRCPSRPGSP
jgi:RNA polymerase sigma-70 factor, ECF subfamily